MRIEPLYVVDMFTGIVKKVSVELESTLGKVYFMYGHPVEAVNTIVELTKQGAGAAKKYPLIYLYMDFEETHSTIDHSFDVSLHFALATWTNPQWKAHERYINTFKTVLYPLLDEFLYQTQASGNFLVLSTSNLDYVKSDRPYWGSANGVGNFADDHCDVIELINFKLKVLPKACTTQVLNTLL